MTKQYAEPSNYEAKLERVMQRLGVEKYNYDWSRHSCWVDFWYKGHLYRFDHSVQNAQNHGVNVRYGSDVFAQVVLSLEDLARMVERGIYDLHVWVAGMKQLPEPKSIPTCFTLMQFSEIPNDVEQITARYRQLSKTAHPDAGGTAEQFVMLQDAYREALKYYGDD